MSLHDVPRSEQAMMGLHSNKLPIRDAIQRRV